MAGLIGPIPATFRLLDPGAGIGILTAAVCDRLLQLTSPRRVDLQVFENDDGVLPLLRANLTRCAEALSAAGHEVSYEIHTKDFILDTAATTFGQQPSLFPVSCPVGPFDAVIMNPPYFKVAKDSRQARIMRDVVHGQPNIYAFFLALASELLRPNGRLVAITPRSFCNGLYFRGFRRWFLDRMALDHLHLFESRTDTFCDVLQESIISAAHRRGKVSATVTVTTSHSRDLRRSDKGRSLPLSTIVDDNCGECLIRIPASEEDAEIIGTVESWPNRFRDIGLRVSTGPVVTFRAREFLLAEANGAGTAPLLNPGNVKPFRTLWPATRKKHPEAFRVCKESMRLLLPTRNYVLLRRFTTKEERRRLVASQLLKTQLDGPYVALENHLNYVYHSERDLTVDETYGLTALFNSALLDRYFRAISGNTQVNATELRTMNFPALSTIARIGKSIRQQREPEGGMAEQIVFTELGVGAGLRRFLTTSNTLF